MTSSGSPRLRLWPALTIAGLAIAALALIWLLPADSRQSRVMVSILVGASAFVLLVLWLIAASGLRWWQRGVAFLAVAGIVAFLAASLELRGFTGDVVPRFAFKWSERPEDRLTAGLPERAAPGPATMTSVDVPGTDFPQFLGPHRNATVDGVRLARDWQASPPELLWRRGVGAGNSGIAVARGIAVTQEQRGDDEMVVAYDLATGEPRWAHATPTRHSNPLSGDGPCATPSIVDGTVYALGATGRLSALDLATGAEQWSTDVLTGAGAQKPVYGLCGSPLVLDDLVIVIAGGRKGALVAYDRTDGSHRWAGGNYRAAYTAPMLATFDGGRQIVVFHKGGPAGDITGHALDGHALWHTPWDRAGGKTGFEVTSQPVQLPGDRILVSAGYGAGARVFEVSRRGDAFEATEVWASNAIKAKLTQIVHQDGTLYGLDDGILAAVDAATGERRWKRGRYGHGQILLVGDVIVVLSEKGIVALVDASPEAYDELGRFQAIEGRTWNTPALAGVHLLVRNTQEMACYRLPTAS